MKMVCLSYHMRCLSLFVSIAGMGWACGAAAPSNSVEDSVSVESMMLAAHIASRIKANPQLLPIEAFARLPEAQSVKISPGGRYISFLKNIEGETGLITVNLATGKANALVKTDNRSMRFRWYEWANDDQLIASVIYVDPLATVKYYMTKLIRATADNSEAPRVIVKPSEDSVGILTNSSERVSQFQDNVIDFLPEDPEHVLLSADFDKPLYPGVYSLNIDSGVRHRLKEFSKPIRAWMTDQQGEIRIGIGVNKDYDRRFVKVRHAEKNDWKKAWEYTEHSGDAVSPLGFGIDPNVLYVRAYQDDRKAIFKVDLSKPDWPRTLVAADPRYDISGPLIYSPKTRDVIGVYHGEAADARIYFDRSYKKFQESINRVLPDTVNYIIDLSRDERRYIVFSTNDDAPGTYYWGDRDQNSLQELFVTYPLLTRDKLPPTKKVSYKARDGVEIEAYLTVPDGKAGPLATVVMPHGGPFNRDYGGFDYWKAFFVNRGYAVLQPNFRGSTGYGRQFQMAAFKGFGDRPQDDIADGAKWLIEQGIAAEKKICIVGASFGGYSALMGAVKTPDLYQCAISFAGLSDLKAYLDGQWYYAGYEAIKRQIGDDRETLKQHSPRRRVSEIEIPILLVHGVDDVTVPVEQSQLMADALEKRQRIFKYVELEEGTHHLSIERNRIRLFQEMDLFLAEHLEE